MFLAVFIPALMGALATAMGSFIGRAILALGIGFVTYTGISAGMGAIKSSVINSIGGMPADMAGLVGYLWLDRGVNIIFSAVSIALAMRGLSGSVKKMVLK